jgi:hypothetical protein
VRRQSLQYRRSWYRRGRGGLYPWKVIKLPWASYERYAYTFWRIRIPLWLAGAGAGWALAGPAGSFAGLVVAYVAEGVFSYRTAVVPRQGPKPRPLTDAEIAVRRAQARRWETEAVPSPAGWQPPDGARPGWSWLPPDGLRDRLDRVPRWVRLWFKTPLVDRYAHAWMWEHGGWDVLPPSASDSQE